MKTCSLPYKNMNNGRKISSKYVLALIFTGIFFSVTFNSPANYSSRLHFYKTLTAVADTIPPGKKQIDTTTKPLLDSLIEDSLGMKDTVIQKADTVDFKVSKDSIDAPINYSASDSIVMDVPTNQGTLYNKATVKQKDLSLGAYKIQMDQNTQVVTASYIKDTSGKIIGLPEMKSSDNNTTSDSIIYNMKTGKGITKSSNTTSGEMFIYGEKMKKVAPEVYYASGGRFTTCNLDTPHFAFVAKKIKLINKKFAITGPVHAEFEGVPIPIYLPFGFFPLAQGRHSGILAPVFTVSDQYGLGLEGLGYYKVISDNLDVTTKVDLYSYGGWKFYLTPEYYVRYHYRGSVNFVFQDTKILSTTGTTEFDVTKTFNFAWSHTVDSKARPGTTFSANVNVASTKFNQLVLNNPTANYTNNLSSSIAYSKTWDQGKVNLTISGNHNQDNITKVININLPNIGFNVTTLYPFQEKEFIGTPKWYEKLGIGLTTSISGLSSFYDSLFSFKSLIDTFQWGAHHSIPISLALPPLGVFQVAPGISLQENWYSQKTLHTWGPYGVDGNDSLISNIQKGFFTANSASFSLSLSTAIFGTFTKFGKNSSIIGIRHVIRPTFSISYSPDLNKQYYQNVQVDSAGEYQPISVFANSTYGAFAQGRFGGISFGLDNNIEMKKRSKKDTTAEGIKKIKLIDGIGFTGSYNYLADSFKLSPIGFYLRSTLFGVINITGSTTLNPYVTNDSGFQKNIYAWNNPNGKFSLGKISTGNIAISASFRSKPKDQKQADAEKKANEDNQGQIPMTMEEEQAQLNYIRTHAAEFADFNIAWSLNLSYSFSFTNSIRPNYSGYQTIINSGLNVSGDFNLTEKWKVGLTTFYDVKEMQINSLQASLSRDLHCWQMSISITPIGLYRSFNITISPKAAILRDLRINRNRYFYTE
jgi:LPS-assembly protein